MALHITCHDNNYDQLKNYPCYIITKVNDVGNGNILTLEHPDSVLYKNIHVGNYSSDLFDIIVNGYLRNGFEIKSISSKPRDYRAEFIKIKEDSYIFIEEENIHFLNEKINFNLKLGYSVKSMPVKKDGKYFVDMIKGASVKDDR